MVADAENQGTAAGARRRAIVVLGMHRSGTSALTGVVAMLGAATPARLMEAATSNPRGYWEPVAIVQAHDDILRALGVDWSTWRTLPAAWFRSEAAAGYRAMLTDLVVSEYGSSNLFVLKDPRMCRLLPLWHRVFAAVAVEPAFLIALRHPLAVAASLERREGVSVGRWVLVWMRHMLEAEISTRTRPRAIVGYDGLIADWRAELGAAGRCIGIEWPLDDPERSEAVEAFLSSELRHHGTPLFDDAVQAILPLAGTVYRLLQRLRAGDDSAATLAGLDSARQETAAWCRLFGDIGPEFAKEFKRSPTASKPKGAEAAMPSAAGG